MILWHHRVLEMRLSEILRPCSIRKDFTRPVLDRVTVEWMDHLMSRKDTLIPSHQVGLLQQLLRSSTVREIDTASGRSHSISPKLSMTPGMDHIRSISLDGRRSGWL